MSTDQQNLYEIIGLPRDASRDQIEKQCLRLGEKYGPDRNPGDLRAAHRFVKIEQAYDTLIDPVKRAAYDAQLRGAGTPQAHAVAPRGEAIGRSAASGSVPVANMWRVIPIEDAVKHPLYGVRGWLLLLVAGMMVLGPVFGAIDINGSMLTAEYRYPALISMNEWETLKFAAWSTFAVAAALSFYGGWGLARGNDWSVVKRAKAILWISGPGAALILEVLVIWIVVLDNAQAADAQIMRALIPSVIGTVERLIPSVIAAAIWSAYLSKSRRVRVTFEHSVLNESPRAKKESSMPATPAKALQTNTPDASNVPISAETQARSARPIANVGEEFWAAALAEYEDGNRRPGLWARAFSDAQGNDPVAKANYLKHRAEELSREHYQHELAQATELDAFKERQSASLSEAQRLNEVIPKWHCPNCKAFIPVSSDKCSKCGAQFTATFDGWKVL